MRSFEKDLAGAPRRYDVHQHLRGQLVRLYPLDGKDDELRQYEQAGLERFEGLIRRHPGIFLGKVEQSLCHGICAGRPVIVKGSEKQDRIGEQRDCENGSRGDHVSSDCAPAVPIRLQELPKRLAPDACQRHHKQQDMMVSERRVAKEHDQGTACPDKPRLPQLRDRAPRRDQSDQRREQYEWLLDQILGETKGSYRRMNIRSGLRQRYEVRQAAAIAARRP